MVILKANVKATIQKPGILGLYEHIERCGRVCYKSENQITKGSAERFVKILIAHGHTSVLEHGTLYLMIPLEHEARWQVVIANIIASPYSSLDISNRHLWVTTNLRVIVEATDLWEEFINAYALEEPDLYHKKRFTAHWVISRGIANEFVRHRVFSFSQESTRYVNYLKKPMQFIIPEWYNGDQSGSREVWIRAMQSSESYYNQLKVVLKNQDARGVLPLDLKTELVMTGNLEQWEEFFKLRTSPQAHPDARVIAEQWRDILLDL